MNGIDSYHNIYQQVIDFFNFIDFRKLVTSKFEPTYARRAFPCLDEPDQKATFDISLVKPKEASPGDWTALSNMNELQTVDGPGANEQTTTFNTSVKMSTYLACFIVSQFKSIDAKVTNLDGNTFDLRTFAPAHLTSNTQFANDAAVSITGYYIKYFDIGYPLPKLGNFQIYLCHMPILTKNLKILDNKIIWSQTQNQFY
jgi:glutamyl aminopeptidase